MVMAAIERKIWPDSEPTFEQARTLVAMAQRATDATPTPATIILQSTAIAIPSPKNMLLNTPFEGPPLPRFLQVRWTNDDLSFIKRTLGVSNPEPPLGMGEMVAGVAAAGVVGALLILSILAAGPLLAGGFKGAKPHKKMEMDYLPDTIPRIDVYVLSKKVEGDFSALLKNLSSEVEIPGEGDIRNTMNAAENEFKERLMDAVKQANDRIPVKETAKYLLKQGILYKGAWDLIKKLYDLLVRKKIKVHLEAPTRIAGFETEKFIVDDFEKQFTIDATVKVEKVRWHVTG